MVRGTNFSEVFDGGFPEGLYVSGALRISGNLADLCEQGSGWVERGHPSRDHCVSEGLQGHSLVGNCK